MSNLGKENRLKMKSVSFDGNLKDGHVKNVNDVRKNSMADKSFMEIENRREKKRWIYMSELGCMFGDRRHTRDDFKTIFESRVRILSL